MALENIIEQLTEARGTVVAQLARVDEILKERTGYVADLERIDRALEALQPGKKPAPVGEVVTEMNGNGNGHSTKKKNGKAKLSAKPDEFDGVLGKIVRLLEKRRTPASAKVIHKRVATAGTHEASTYSALKRAIDRGVLRRTGDIGAYRFELARQ